MEETQPEIESCMVGKFCCFIPDGPEEAIHEEALGGVLHAALPSGTAQDRNPASMA